MLNWYRLLNRAWQVYYIRNKEWIPVKCSCLLLSLNLEALQRTIQTDYNVFRWRMNSNNAAGRLARVRCWLSEFDSKVVDRSVVNLQAADAFSRGPKTLSAGSLFEDILTVLKISEEEPDGANIGSDKNTWRSNLCRDGMDIVKAALPGLPPVPVWTVIENPHQTRSFMRAETNAPTLRNL